MGTPVQQQPRSLGETKKYRDLWSAVKELMRQIDYEVEGIETNAILLAATGGREYYLDRNGRIFYRSDGIPPAFLGFRGVKPEDANHDLYGKLKQCVCQGLVTVLNMRTEKAVYVIQRNISHLRKFVGSLAELL